MLTFTAALDQLQERVLPQNEQRGEVLLIDDRVQIISAGRGHLRAGVADGERRYTVSINWETPDIRLSCACGAVNGHICPHVWAAALAAEESGLLDADGEDDDSPTFTLLKQMAAALQPQVPARPKPEPKWKRDLDAMTRLTPASGDPKEAWPASRQLLYVIDRYATLEGKGIQLETFTRERRKDGEWAKPKAFKLGREKIDRLPESDDRVIAAMLCGATSPTPYYGYSYYYDRQAGSDSFKLDPNLSLAVLPLLGRSGRLFLRPNHLDPDMLQPLGWGSDTRWSFTLDVELNSARKEYVVQGILERDGERRPLAQPTLLTQGGLVFWDKSVEPLDDGGAFNWIVYLRGAGTMRIPQTAGMEFSKTLYRAQSRPPIRLPQEIQLQEVRVPAKCCLKLRAPKPNGYDKKLIAQLQFDYQGIRASAEDRQSILSDDKVILRDVSTEALAMARLGQLGFRNSYIYESRSHQLTLTPSKLAKTVSALVQEGWQVEAEGKLYRQPGAFNIEVTSGIDWFELHGKVQFGDQVATLPQLLTALRKGDSFVQLGDGTVGMLPEEWLKKYGQLAGMGKEEGDHLKFARAQVGLLDALIAAQPEARCDEVFEKTRQMMRSFEGIKALAPHEKFKGTLRPYQSEGLGWLAFLRDFSFGGCLADDMGLGKTVQVLAMLQSRKMSANGDALPTLIVVPRSLVFNWMSEAEKFAPELRVLDHSHTARTRAGDHFADYDIVLTTYGTLRRDAAYLKDIEFDYVILDEAQAIKNGTSDSAKAARLLKARHRLALSGTPVQNHLGDLWSLFEFLNPGMLGTSSVLTGAASLTKAVDGETKMILARALRPFILRRTKEQVAKDLPEKLEQTIYCELEPEQRKAYNDLKEYYRASLLDLVATQGINKAKIQILEALLRLRQAACHPGLIDKSKTGAGSAKLDMLLERLEEIAEEGHKALVFSQFTSFLDIVKKRLDKLKIKYEYLDGKTKDRQERVNRFQTTDKCKLFLISLKAGGVGLNLTSADYVFLLDPWWNPAVEAQAIDRTHRIGQTKKVYACRLIARDTVEEKVLQLQKSKKDLADAIISADNSVISTLGKAELELLLS